MQTGLDHLQSWIGRTEERSELLTPRLAESFQATFDLPPRVYADGDAAPIGVQWCLGNPLARASELDRDGHPKRGGFMPPIFLPRRMWAARELTFHDALRVGSLTTRISTIRSITPKQGSSGLLVFLVIEHCYVQDGTTRLSENQTIVYREAVKPGEHLHQSAQSPGRGEGDIRQVLTTNPTLLFRYSALTFNSHRIHYDQAYARDTEGYPALVVHGPLIATMLLHTATAAFATSPSTFEFRAMRPLFAEQAFTIDACMDNAVAELWAANAHGEPVMTARAALAEKGGANPPDAGANAG